MITEVSIKLDKINLKIVIIMFLVSWLMIFELLELPGPNKMCFIINKSTTQNLRSIAIGYFK